jgi:pimeloyl-ACP methyl ester carboxylesterase
MKKSLVIFVHGIQSDIDCWHDLKTLLDADPAINAAFDREYFPYESKLGLGVFNFTRKLPDYSEIAKEFDTFVSAKLTPDYYELYLVGHSQGGLVLQEWLVRLLNAGRGRELRRVRELLLIATPTLGSNLALGPRKAFFSFVNDPQEARLRAFNTQAADTRRAIELQVMRATRNDDRNCPIPIVSFWGTEDNIVQSASAEASFDISIALPGDHLSIIRPKDRDDPRYRQIAQALLVPVGHAHIFEIDTYETCVRVAPLTGDQQGYTAKRDGIAVAERSDNVARIDRRVCFSPKNHCRDLFRFNYRTNKLGYLTVTHDMQPREPGEPLPPNEAGTDEITSDREFTYKFAPLPGRCHSERIDLWNGFNPGGRDVHFHTGNNFRARRYTFTVDLVSYLSAGWKIAEPRLFITKFDTGEHDISEQRLEENRVPVSDTSRPGLWIWNLENFRGGIVDAVWDVSESTNRG